MFAFLPEFLQTPSAAGYGFGASITESGLIVLPMSVSMFGFGVFSGRLASRFSAKAVLVFGSAVSVLPLLILAFAHSHIWQIAVATFLLGAGFGLAFAAMSSIIVDSVPSSQTGVASGMNANIRTIGGSVGAAVMASVVTSGCAGRPAEGVQLHRRLRDACRRAAAGRAGRAADPDAADVRDQHQQEQAAMSHPELAIVAGGTLVGNEPE